MDRICTQYGLRRELDTRVDQPPEDREPRTARPREVRTRVVRPPREPDTRVSRPPTRRRFVITVPQHLAEDFGIAPTQVAADLYAIDCSRLARR